MGPHKITITTRLVDVVAIPMRSRSAQSKRIDATQFITHHFKLADSLDAYEIFATASETPALKVMVQA